MPRTHPEPEEVARLDTEAIRRGELQQRETSAIVAEIRTLLDVLAERFGPERKGDGDD